ncbi:hypothetical protein B0H13DRAFT_1891924 [Mycena leptocephala]|nr:hypothetical protein B0H13DRAFT_1891924 [Mycena leptocephala]
MGDGSGHTTPTTSNELVLIWAAEGGAEREEAAGVLGGKSARWWGAGRVNGGEKGGGRCPESNGVVPSRYRLQREVQSRRKGEGWEKRAVVWRGAGQRRLVRDLYGLHRPRYEELRAVKTSDGTYEGLQQTPHLAEQREEARGPERWGSEEEEAERIEN